MRMRTLLLAAGLAGAAAGAACLGPYQIIGQALDTTISLGDQPTWIQATPEKTTLIVFAAADGGFSAPFTLTTVARDQSSEILTGSYFFNGNEVTLSATQKYVWQQQYNLPVTQRTGTQRFDIDAGVTYGYARDGGVLTLTGDPPLGSFAYFPEALAGLKATTEPEAECVLRVFQLTVISSETRILGFNGPGIIQYTTPATFNGTLSGTLTISVESLLSPNVTITYQNLADFSGWVVDGTQYTPTDLGGNGSTLRTVAFRMSADPGDGGAPATILSGQVDYNLLLVSGTPSGGTYTLTTDGGPTFPLSYQVATVMDVTACVMTPR
jgi:hypothetical protein